MAGEGIDWTGLLPLSLLLLLPVLAAAAILAGLTLRKRLVAMQHLIDRLRLEATAREAEARLGRECLEDLHACHTKLTLELHHRVKNSLQVIQSYLTLSRRHKVAGQDRHLAEVDVKVQVISTAYRLALSEGTMEPIPLRAFVGAVVENAQAILGNATCTITASIVPDCPLVLDRAIPLGLAIVEAIIAARNAPTIMHIDVRIQRVENGVMALAITIDDLFAEVDLPLRLMAGLQSQLGAHPRPCAGEAVLNWHFAA